MSHDRRAAGRGFLVSGVLALAATACGGDQSLAEACGGEQPPLNQCFVGDFVADCGGDSTPVLACASPSGADCRWFESGCVALGYQPSDCPNSDICCHADWPFEELKPFELERQLFGLGTQPWTRERELTVSVTVDSTLTVSETTFVCEGTDPERGSNTPCTGWMGVPQARFGGTLVLASPNSGVSGWYPWLELDLEHAGGPMARVCLYTYTDVYTGQCPQDRDASCAVSGTLAINRIPAKGEDLSGLLASVDVQFASGFRLSGTVAVP